MTDVWIKAALASADTGGGTQDIVAAGIDTAKACLLVMGSVAADNTVEAGDLQLSVGFASGAALEGTTYFDSEHDLPTSNANRGSTNDSVIAFYSLSSPGTVVAEAELQALITGGIRLNWLTTPGSAFRIIGLLFGGADLGAAVGEKVQGATVSGLSIAPKFAFEMTNGATIPGTAATSVFSLGAAFDNGVSIEQAAQYFSEQDNSAIAAVSALLRDDSVSGQLLSSSNTWNDQVTSFTSDGYVTSAAGGADELLYLALALGGLAADVRVIDIPTTAGVTSYTVGFPPGCLMFIGSDMTAVNTVKSDGEGAGQFISVVTPEVESAIVFGARDGQTDTRTFRGAASRAILIYDHNGTKVAEASFDSFRSDGYRLNVTTAPATALKVIAIAFQASHHLSPATAQLSLSGSAPTLDLSAGLSPARAALSLVGHAPSFRLNHIRSPAAAAVALAGNAPLRTVNVRRSPAKADLTLTAYSPGLSANLSFSLVGANLILAGAAPAVALSNNLVFSPATAALVLSSSAPLAGNGVALAPDAAALSISTSAPGVFGWTDTTSPSEVWVNV